MLQYLLFGIALNLTWVISGWFIKDFMTWFLWQQIFQIMPYDFFQVCWAAISFVRYKCAKNSRAEDHLKITKFTAMVWTVFLISTGWKFSIDLLLPFYIPAFENFVGIVGYRTWYQRLVWCVLLQFILTFVEVFALVNYHKLTQIIQKPFEFEDKMTFKYGEVRKIQNEKKIDRLKVVASVSKIKRSVKYQPQLYKNTEYDSYSCLYK